MWAAWHLLSFEVLADFRRLTESARADLRDALEAGLYERATKSAWADYQRITARTFGELFCKEE